MAEDWERDPRSPRMRPDDAGSFASAFWRTVLIIGGTALLSVAGAAHVAIYYLWFLAVLLAFGGIACAFVEANDGRRSAAAGIVAGVAVSALILTVTCFANIRLIETLDQTFVGRR